MALHKMTQQERNYEEYHELLAKDTDGFSTEQLEAHNSKLNELSCKISKASTEVLQSLNESATAQVVQLNKAIENLSQVAANDETAFAVVKLASDIIQIAGSTVPSTF